MTDLQCQKIHLDLVLGELILGSQILHLSCSNFRPHSFNILKIIYSSIEKYQTFNLNYLRLSKNCYLNSMQMINLYT